MNPFTRRLLLALTASSLAGCASTTWKNYPGGTMKYSAINYNYTALPVLKDPVGKTYQLIAPEFSGISSVAAFEKRGVRRTDGAADVTISIKAGPIRHEPAGFGIKTFRPAQRSSMPIDMAATDRAGQSISARSFLKEEFFVLNAAPEFATREQARAAMSAISEITKSKAEEKVKQDAQREVTRHLDLLAQSLFEPRQIKVTLPAIRAAGELDMEAAYTALSEARGVEQVTAAQAAYAALGTAHKKPDGSDDVLANYGVSCGVASAKILAGDLGGAWLDIKQAGSIMPMGTEHRLIAKVLYDQQEQAGVEIISKEDFDEMANGDKKMMNEQLKALFGGKKK